MEYHLRQAVWEITYECNMRCKHCGSSCGNPLTDELTTDEALNVCEDLAKLKLEHLTLSGGEPFLRKDWHLIAKYLTGRGIAVNCISNGWFIDSQLIEKAKDCGISNIGISVDGLRETHDFMRRSGSFDRAMNALEIMRQNDMPTVVCTTVNKRNMNELELLSEYLKERSVQRWQFQIGRPMGNLLRYPELILQPNDIVDLINFCYDTMKKGDIVIDLADDIGYYSLKDTELRKQSSDDSDVMWQGCGAGKTVVGIRANGDISGCLSIRDRNFIEGNVRQTSLFELWTKPGAFAWNRDFSEDKLTGFCGKCQYRCACLGGCSGTKITMHNCLSHNDHCIYKVCLEREIKAAETISNVDDLINLGRKYADAGELQLADSHLQRALTLQQKNTEVLNLLGYVHYYLNDFDQSKTYNMQSLEQNPRDPYALSGYGLCLDKLGDFDGAVKHLELAIENTSEDFLDPYYDLAIVLSANGKTNDAIEILERGRAISAEFKDKSAELYKSLNSHV